MKSPPCPSCGKRKLKVGPRFETGVTPPFRQATPTERLRCSACGASVYSSDRTEAMTAFALQQVPRIESPEDVEPVLAEVLKAGREDPRLSSSALRVLEVLHSAAAERTSVELTAARWWLMERTGLSEPAVRRALARLEKTEYLATITPKQVTRKTLKRWLKTRESGRPPILVRLADHTPGPAAETGQNHRPQPPATTPGHR